MPSEFPLIIGFILLIFWVFFIFSPFIGSLEFSAFFEIALPFLSLFLILVGVVKLKTEKRLGWVKYFFRPTRKKIFTFFLIAFLFSLCAMIGDAALVGADIVERIIESLSWFFLFIPLMSPLTFIALAFFVYLTSCLVVYIYDKFKKKPLPARF